MLNSEGSVSAPLSVAFYNGYLASTQSSLVSTSNGYLRMYSGTTRKAQVRGGVVMRGGVGGLGHLCMYSGTTRKAQVRGAVVRGSGGLPARTWPGPGMSSVPDQDACFFVYMLVIYCIYMLIFIIIIIINMFMIIYIYMCS